MLDQNTDTRIYVREKLAEARLRHIPHGSADAIASKLKKVQKCGFKVISVNPKQANGYDTVIQVNHYFRANKQQSKPTITLIAFQSEMGHIKSMTITKSGTADYEAKKDALCSLISGENYGGRFSDDEKLRLYGQSARNETIHHQGYNEVLDALDRLLKASVRSFQTYLEKFTVKNNFKQYKARDAFNEKLINDFRVFLQNSLDGVHTKLSELINHKVMGWAEEIEAEPYSNLSEEENFRIYNHMLYGEASYRYTALKQFSPLGRIFISTRYYNRIESIWKKIDEGSSPIAALAEKFNVKTSTVKKMAKTPDVFCVKDKPELYSFRDHQDILEIAEMLDCLDHMHWPQTKLELMFFSSFYKNAQVLEDKFGIDKHQYIKDRINQYKNEEKVKRRMRARAEGTAPETGVIETSWQGIYMQTFKPIIQSAIASMDRESSINYLIRDMIENIDFSDRKAAFEKTLGLINDSKEFWEYTSKVFANAVTNAEDLKTDLLEKLINPVMLVELKRLGLDSRGEYRLESLSDRLSASFWEKATASELLEMSAYWHSDRVDIQRRFKSAALSEESLQNWPGLLGTEPYQLEDNVFVHPLCSADDLTLESDMMSIEGRMRFCIWSYSSRFYTSQYHMMSIRDANGVIISTLTVQDYIDDEGLRKIRFCENKSKGNGAPCAVGEAAANKILDMVNEGEVDIDWAEIDKSRNAYESRKLEFAAGYDIHDVETRQSVLDVYEPCLPRKLLSKRAKTFNNFAAALDVEGHVKKLSEINKNKPEYTSRMHVIRI